VGIFINTCLNGRVSSNGDAIASFLYGETGGNPLFLQTLMMTLLKEQMVAFDYGSLQWKFNLVALQSHLSDASFDAYLYNVMRRQPPDVQDILRVSLPLCALLTLAHGVSSRDRLPAQPPGEHCQHGLGGGRESRSAGSQLGNTITQE
jgi:hypothetical protein